MDVIQAILIALIVATFLLHTGRALKAIEICKECLIFLNTKALGKKSELINIFTIAAYERIFNAYNLLPDYTNAIKYGRELLDICHECGNAAAERKLIIKLADIYKRQYKYAEAKELYEKAINITEETGDREVQAVAYEEFGTMSYRLGEYDKAKEYHEKALAIVIEIGDQAGEARSYGNLGAVFRSLGEYQKAKEYHEKALAIRIEIGDRAGQALGYGNLGTVFQCLGEYEKSKEYLEKALAISIEIGDRETEATLYGNLAGLFHPHGEYDMAKEYLEKSLAIKIEIGDRAGQAGDYGNLGAVFQSLGEYEKSKKYLEETLAFKIEIGDREGEADLYGSLGVLFQSLGEYDKAKEYLEKALVIRIDIGDRVGKAMDYRKLGTLFRCSGQYVMAEGCLKEALSISQDIGDAKTELLCYHNLTLVKFLLGETQEAFAYLLLGINKSEHLRGFLRHNDQFKISFSDFHNFPNQCLAAFLCVTESPNDALYVLELARARALADLMATQYNVEMQISADPQSWIGIENVMKKESNSTCLYFSYFGDFVFLWILKNSGVIHFRRITANENIVGAKLVSSLDDFFAGSFQHLGILPQPGCEDRSLNSSELETNCPQEEKLADVRLVKNDDDDNQDPSTRSLLYKMIIAPVADLLEEPEIIIVPDRALYQVPFAALSDMSGKYLSETFRIRIVPSLSTLKLIQDSQADYHSQTGALIVGDPVVGRVRYKGRRKNFLPLPRARKEAEMIGELLGVHPLLGKCATKQAVLKSLHSVSLIHFAAHGDAERGEIALSPLRSTKKIPREEDYLLTMSDISQVQLRAKLVVLSCCHGGCGQIRAEGVIGIARAFLGSGARSVLVALWALDDSATEQLMHCFYEHLVRGESASESLYKTMRWMRGNGFTEVSKWAPFMLIGDNVTFDFGK